jgi:uncharacterized protein YchJ
MITEADVERAVAYLRDTAEPAAKARAERLYLDDYSRVLKATIMSEHLAEPVNAQERHAYSDMRYRNHLEALRLAIFEDEKSRFLRAAAEAKIEAWRTMESTRRAEGKAYS